MGDAAQESNLVAAAAATAAASTAAAVASESMLRLPFKGMQTLQRPTATVQALPQVHARP
jgi:hypothetical protein